MITGGDLFKSLLFLCFGLLILLLLIYKYVDMADLILKLGYKLYVNTSFGPRYFKRELIKASTKYENGFHSNIKVLKYGFVNVTIIPYSLNNYGFIIWTDKQLGCFLIDPGNALPFQDYLVKNKLIPKLILITHKHHDHSYGLSYLIDLYPNVQVVGSAADRLRSFTYLIEKEQEIINFQFSLKKEEQEPSLSIVGFLTPGHTIGHVIYSINIDNTSIENNGEYGKYALYFTGDTIFLGSIGRMFECKPSVYFKSIQRFIESLLELNCLIENVYLFPAHEYSIVNLRFITEILNFSNTKAITKLDWCRNQREIKEPTIPCQILEEFSYNPFLEIVMSDNTQLLAKLNQKFNFNLNMPDVERILMTYYLSKSQRKFLANIKPELNLPERLFLEVRKMRDSVNFNE